MSDASADDKAQDGLMNGERKSVLRLPHPFEISILTGIVLTAAFIGLEFLIFHRSSPKSGEWKLMDDAKFFCDNRPNCYPHPTDNTLCGRPFTCGQKISEWDLSHCTVNKSEVKTKGDFVFVLQANAKMEETIHKIATKIWENYEKKLIVLFDDDETADLCKISYNNLEIRCAPFKKDGKKFLCGTVHCSSENGYICELEKIINEYEAVFFMREPLEFNSIKKGNLIEYVRSFNKSMLTMGGTFFRTPSENNYISYFPGEIPATTRKFEALYFERSAWENLKWVKSFLFESVYGPSHNAQHNTLLHLIEKIKSDHDYPHVPRPDSLSGPPPIPSGIEIYRALYISLVIFFMFIAYSCAYGATLRN